METEVTQFRYFAGGTMFLLLLIQLSFNESVHSYDGYRAKNKIHLPHIKLEVASVGLLLSRSSGRQQSGIRHDRAMQSFFKIVISKCLVKGHQVVKASKCHWRCVVKL